MTTQQMLIKMTSLSLGYGDHVVLRDINLNVQTGQFWFFLGQNGGRRGRPRALPLLANLVVFVSDHNGGRALQASCLGARRPHVLSS